MTGFELLADINRKRIGELADKAVDQFRGAIRPIYGSSEQGSPSHIGSCIGLKIDGRLCLLTAAHVIDWNIDTSLYVGGTDLTLLSMDFIATVKPQGDRCQDRHDFAIGELSAEDVTRLGDIDFVTEADISSGEVEPPGTVFTSIGYPNSKNRKIDYINKSVSSQIYSFSNIGCPSPVLAQKLGVSGADHLFIAFDAKYSLDAAGKRVSSVRLNGVSGGAVFNIGNFGNPEVVAGSRDPKPRLTALFIEFRKANRMITATRLKTILMAYRHQKNHPVAGSRRSSVT